eukprot:Tbor_TRINITY_DN6019_c1_g6::TRINITY_DN6019_c1_g6_i11::g.11243::m.11243
MSNGEPDRESITSDDSIRDYRTHLEYITRNFGSRLKESKKSPKDIPSKKTKEEENQNDLLRHLMKRIQTLEQNAQEKAASENHDGKKDKEEAVHKYLSRQMRETEENINYPHLSKLRPVRLDLKEREEECLNDFEAFKQSLKRKFHARIEAKSMMAYDAIY